MIFTDPPVCTGDEDRTCELPGESYWIDDADERLDARVLYPALIEVDAENHVSRAVDPMPDDLRTKRTTWENDPLTVAFVRDCDPSTPDCKTDGVCDGSKWKLTGEWIIHRGDDSGTRPIWSSVGSSTWTARSTRSPTTGPSTHR